MKKYNIGYTQGTFDMFHMGHLNLLRNAKKMCEKLIVGVNSDALVQKYKQKNTVINEQERVEIIKELRCVDDVFVCNTLDKMPIWNEIRFDAIFIGDDWKGNPRWEKTEQELSEVNSKVVYLKHTDGISSSMLRTEENKKVSDDKDSL